MLARSDLVLFWRTKRRESRADQPFADMTHASRATGAGVFLEEDHLLVDAQPPATMLHGPARTNPATLGQHLFPGLAQVGSKVFITGPAPEPQYLKFPCQVLLHPLRDLFAKLLVCCAEANIHERSPKICLASCSR